MDIKPAYLSARTKFFTAASMQKTFDLQKEGKGGRFHEQLIVRKNV